MKLMININMKLGIYYNCFYIFNFIIFKYTEIVFYE